jgi:adenylate cyclase
MVGHFRLKGFDRVVEVYELMGDREKAEQTRAVREGFAQGLELFQKMKFQAAEAAFRKVLDTNPGDGPSHFYVEKIEDFAAHPPPAEWHGEIELKEK